MAGGQRQWRTLGSSGASALSRKIASSSWSQHGRRRGARWLSTTLWNNTTFFTLLRQCSARGRDICVRNSIISPAWRKLRHSSGFILDKMWGEVNKIVRNYSPLSERCFVCEAKCRIWTRAFYFRTHRNGQANIYIRIRHSDRNYVLLKPAKERVLRTKLFTLDYFRCVGR